MNSLDIRFAVQLLQPLTDAKLTSIKTGEALVLEFFKPGLGKNFLVFSQDRIFLTKSKPPTSTATSFCMKLRKHLDGRRLAAATQLGFDRIVRLDFDETSLILELFDGNILLLESEKILAALHPRDWKTRSLKPGAIYSPPPGPPLPETLASSKFTNLPKPLAAFLPTLGFSGLSKELCTRAAVSEQSKSLSPEDATRLLAEIQKLLSAEPVGIVLSNRVSSIELTTEPTVQKFSTLFEAVETFEPPAVVAAKKEDPTKKILASIPRLEEEEAKARAAGEAILSNLPEVAAAIAAAKGGKSKTIKLELS